tara:strand:+ start:2769 stop:3116 length:348 start_codon:yes stop_codon:yes gene_type:complete
MIDTNKYEGHTPGPWRVDKTSGIVTEGGMPVTALTNQRFQTMTLMADAPLLLAEVKRLRRAFHIATAHIGYGNHLGHAELRRALNSVGIDHNSLPWADGEWVEPLPTFGGVAHYD